MERKLTRQEVKKKIEKRNRKRLEKQKKARADKIKGEGNGDSKI